MERQEPQRSFESRLAKLAQEVDASIAKNATASRSEAQNDDFQNQSITQQNTSDLDLCITNIDFSDLFNATIAADSSRLESILNFGANAGVNAKAPIFSEKEKLISFFSQTASTDKASVVAISDRAWKASRTEEYIRDFLTQSLKTRAGLCAATRTLRNPDRNQERHELRQSAVRVLAKDNEVYTCIQDVLSKSKILEASLGVWQKTVTFEDRLSSFYSNYTMLAETFQDIDSSLKKALVLLKDSKVENSKLLTYLVTKLKDNLSRLSHDLQQNVSLTKNGFRIKNFDGQTLSVNSSQLQIYSSGTYTKICKALTGAAVLFGLNGLALAIYANNVGGKVFGGAMVIAGSVAAFTIVKILGKGTDLESAVQNYWQKVGSHKLWKESVSLWGNLDSLNSLSEVHRKYPTSTSLPKMRAETGFYLSANKLRNASLIAQHGEEGCSPLDIKFDHSDPVLVTAPNSSGKTYLMDSIMLAEIVGVSGGYVFAEDLQSSLPASIGYFSSEEQRMDEMPGGQFKKTVQEMKTEIDQMEYSGLMLIDEYGNGTYAGEAAKVLLPPIGLAKAKRCGIIVATHLLEFVHSLDEKGMVSTLYFPMVEEKPQRILEPGIATSSGAISVIKQSGMDSDSLALTISADEIALDVFQEFISRAE